MASLFMGKYKIELNELGKFWENSGVIAFSETKTLKDIENL